MDKLGQILDQWEKSKDIESLLTQGLLNDPEALQTSLEALPETLRDKASSTLQHISVALTCFIADMDEEKSEVKSQIDATLKSAQACMSYGAPYRPKKGTD